jgi:hypothetical protein
MATIYLRHPIHGTKVATMDIEAEEDEKNGWVVYTLDTPKETQKAVPINGLESKRIRNN